MDFITIVILLSSLITKGIVYFNFVLIIRSPYIALEFTYLSIKIQLKTLFISQYKERKNEPNPGYLCLCVIVCLMVQTVCYNESKSIGYVVLLR